MIAEMTATLTATVTDQHAGQHAAGMRFQLYWVESHGDVLLRAGATNDAGTTDAPLLCSPKMSAGTYKLVLHVGDYLENRGVVAPRQFLDLLPVMFVIDDASRPTQLHVDFTLDAYAVRRS